MFSNGRFRVVGAVACLVLLAVTSCGGRDKKPAQGSGAVGKETHPTAGGVVYRHLESDCKTLNWVLYTTSYENNVLRLLYDRILDYDRNMEIVPVLARDYEVSKDHLRITVNLRDSLLWDDGKPLTAEDVKFTVDKILDPDVPAVNKEGWFSRLDRVEISGPLTLEFVWKEPYAPCVHALTQLAPVPKHVYDRPDFTENPANRAPVGSGPFKFEEWRTGQMISLVRNPLYHGQKAYLDRVVFKIIPDGSVALSALKTGELDEMRITQIQWETQTGGPDFAARFEKWHYPVPQYNYLAWNCRSVWFHDGRVRRAMTMLFDRETVNRELYSGYADTVTGPFYKRSWAYDASVEPIPFDPAGAMKLLDEAGWKDANNDGVREKDSAKFEFDFFIVSGSETGRRFSELFQEQCRRAGIVVNLRQIEGATFFDKMFKGEYDGTALAWRLENDPDVYDTFHSSQVPPIGLNHTFYSNARVDSLLEAGRVEFDREKRAEIYHRVHRLIAEDQPYTFINSVPEKRPFSKRIGGIVISPNGPFDFYPGAAYWYIKADTTRTAK
ncbi:MAG: extracellular solute-binding protein, family 5 [Candidatus Krumholzibacteriota bacterium]|nr:extracellular solute-binding protein, family 5 [Candidatus Krumholzibacteriota bacterium]